ncbi:MAG TPA: Hsp20/alpha crystallin family protein [Patescibacteria group bacterium]|nr:Hsp20/alpha crystallin family protein [Patescibacteria group bacterium]
MSLMKYDPLREFDAISRRFDNLFQSFRPAFESGLTTQQMFSPRVDIHEDEKNIYFDVELPGLKREDVKISVNEDRYLVLKGEKRVERRWGDEDHDSKKNETSENGSSERKSGKAKEASKMEESAAIQSRNGGSVMRAERQPLRIERSYGSFTRTFTLPENADAEKIDAKFENGVLEITVPKKEPAKPKQIDVNIK